MNYLSVQGISLGAMGVEVQKPTLFFSITTYRQTLQNFDIFLDIDDRFIISINPPSSKQGDTVDVREQRDEWSWDIFNALCQKVPCCFVDGRFQLLSAVIGFEVS
jgi:hypothetical protein